MIVKTFNLQCLSDLRLFIFLTCGRSTLEMKKYSEMTKEELQAELDTLKESMMSFEE